MKKILIAAAALLSSASAIASLTTISGNFSATNWISDSKGDPPAFGDLVDPFILNYSVTFDTAMTINSSPDLTIFFTNFPDPLSFSYNPVFNTLAIGDSLIGIDGSNAPRSVYIRVDLDTGLPDVMFQVNSNGDLFDAGAFTSLGPAGPVGDNAIPEPASWAMLVAGFGLIAAVMRRQRAVAA